MLHQAALLLYARTRRALLHVPPDNVTVLLELLDGAVDAAVLACLSEQHELLQRARAARNDGEPEAERLEREAQRANDAIRKAVRDE